MAARSTAQRTLEARLREQLPSLTPRERRLAEVVLEVGPELAAWTAGEVAERAGVSRATAVRLFRRLGYGSYRELRRQARSERPNADSPLARFASLAGSPLDQAVTAQLGQEVRNLQRTFARLPLEHLDRAAGTLASAERLRVVGFRNSYALAYYARNILLQLRKEVRLLPTAGLTVAEELATIGPGDAVLAIAFRRRPPVLERIIGLAAAAGAEVVVLTEPAGPIREEERVLVLRCEISGTEPFDSYGPALSVLNLLAGQLALRLGADAHARLARIEEIHRQLEELVSVSPRRRSRDF